MTSWLGKYFLPLALELNSSAVEGTVGGISVEMSSD
jgi:hypothetical protein